MTTKRFILMQLIMLGSVIGAWSQVTPSGFAKLDEWTSTYRKNNKNAMGYPTNFVGQLDDFYKWYTSNHICDEMVNNAGNPFDENLSKLSALSFEREVIEWFAPFYGYAADDVWGIVTMSGTDGNNHGIYFGVNYIREKNGAMPIVYVSDEAHYSNFRLCDLQNLEVRLVKSNEMGQMIPDELEKALDTSRPAVVVYAMGSTFKGAIDDMKALNEVLNRHPEMKVYRHVDAALFGGYLPFTKFKDLVNQEKMEFVSICVSGHKFFGIDDPSGLFLTKADVYANQNSFDIEYLNNSMKMINCSRSGASPLKFWWLIQSVGEQGWSKQANDIMEKTAYLKQELERIGWPCWHNEYSNTVFFKRPSKELQEKYILANGYDKRFGGELSHIVVMQHTEKTVIDKFIADLQSTTGINAASASTPAMTQKYMQGNEVLVLNGNNTYTVSGTRR